MSSYVPTSLLISDGSEPRLGSARAIFQKARIEKIGKNEPIWGLDKFKKKDLELIFDFELEFIFSRHKSIFNIVIHMYLLLLCLV